MLKELKNFLLSPTVLPFAIAFILAGAIGLMIKSLVGDIILPLVFENAGIESFAEMTTKVGKATLGSGKFIDTIINFLILGFAMFLLSKIATALMPPPAAGPTKTELLTGLRDKLKDPEVRYSLKNRKHLK